jgi:hypothetical protein
VPEIPPLPRVAIATGTADAVDAVFAADGPLAQAMPAFEPPAGQVEMAGAVARVFLGSVSDRLVHISPKPVLVVH